MTIFMMALGDDSPPPTATLRAKFVVDGSEGLHDTGDYTCRESALAERLPSS